MLKNASGCLQMFSIPLSTPSEPFVTNQYAEDYWVSTLLISGRKKTTVHICVVHVCVINFRGIALSQTVLDSNMLNTININIHQTLNIFSCPWYRPMGTKRFIMHIYADRKRNARLWRETRKLKMAEKVEKAFVFADLFPIQQICSTQTNKGSWGSNHTQCLRPQNLLKYSGSSYLHKH